MQLQPLRYEYKPDNAPGMGLLSQATRLAAAISGGLLALAAMATLLRVAEFADAVGMLRLKVQELLGDRM